MKAKTKTVFRSLDEKELDRASGGGYVSSCLEVGGAAAVPGMIWGPWGAAAGAALGCGAGLIAEYLDTHTGTQQT
jgi:hypothetical protein